jgi:DNA-binding protein H-NS
MAAINLRSMDVDALLSLRSQIDQALSQRRSVLEKELSRLGGSPAKTARGVSSNGRSHPLKGAKVPPKYRNPTNPDETWAGRGAQPRWLTAALKGGKKLTDFLIDKTGGGDGRKRRAVKRRK